MSDESSVAEAPELGGGCWPAMDCIMVRPPPSFLLTFQAGEKTTARDGGGRELGAGRWPLVTGEGDLIERAPTSCA